MIKDNDVQPGAIFKGAKGSDRKIARREGGEVYYVRRLKSGEFGNEPRHCWISTILEWAKEKLEK